MNAEDRYRNRMAARNDARVLWQCGVPFFRLFDGAKPGAPQKVHGVLGPFRIARMYRRGYWVVKGPVPLDAALELYEHRVGRWNIRVDGHCGCPPPEWPWVEWRDADGVRLWKDPDGSKEREHREFYEHHPDWAADAEPVRFVPEPADVDGASCHVTTYHIDTELGLYVFVEVLRRRGLVDAEAAS